MVPVPHDVTVPWELLHFCLFWLQGCLAQQCRVAALSATILFHRGIGSIPFSPWNPESLTSKNNSPLNSNRKFFKKTITLVSPGFLSTSSSFLVCFIQNKFCSGVRAISCLLRHEAICWHLKESTIQFKVQDKCI